MVSPLVTHHGRLKLLLIAEKADGSTTRPVDLPGNVEPHTGPGVKESTPARK
jgi:hypothetical protein